MGIFSKSFSKEELKQTCDNCWIFSFSDIKRGREHNETKDRALKFKDSFRRKVMQNAGAKKLKDSKLEKMKERDVAIWDYELFEASEGACTKCFSLRQKKKRAAEDSKKDGFADKYRQKVLEWIDENVIE
ncbi:hypothetical protein ACFLQI_02955 [Candidatus Undinarchaeota archaeon]